MSDGTGCDAAVWRRAHVIRGISDIPLAWRTNKSSNRWSNCYWQPINRLLYITQLNGIEMPLVGAGCALSRYGENYGPADATRSTSICHIWTLSWYRYLCRKSDKWECSHGNTDSDVTLYCVCLPHNWYSIFLNNSKARNTSKIFDYLQTCGVEPVNTPFTIKSSV